ncbi:hypothetical protein [Mesorhizobium sp. M0496]|uniref:hypothetical protein n=1 Tax=Mesorhizobium sp. M0496 TaxID=2956952 RepID=UPI00333B2277
MKRVKILQPVDGYEIGDTPELTGQRLRELVASGHAERLRDDEGGNPAPAKKAKAPAKKAKAPAKKDR